MKKLLITTMAAVSVGLCAKAADAGFISGTSFETLPEKSYLATNGEATLCEWYGEAGSVLSDDYSNDPELGSRYWMTEATDAQLVVSNVTNFAGDYLSNDNRPQKWSSDENSKALYIDTDKPLMRYVHPSTDGKTAVGADLDQDIFFDSVVQFTATDVAAEPESGDKLRVWLYTSPENLDGTVFGEEEAVTRLVVTAGYYKPGDSTTHKTNYLTNVSISSDSWHRLTIKTFVVGGYTKFNIYVDGEIVKVGDLQDFDSLFKVDGQDTLQCVAFDGKGAVDDIVFTTTDPFAVATYTVSTTINDVDGAAYTKQYSVDGGASYTDFVANDSSPFVKDLLIPQTVQNIKFKFLVYPGYEVEGATKTTETVVVDGESYIYWEKQIAVSSISFTDNVGEITLNVVLGEEVTYPTVKPNGDSATQGTLSPGAVAAIEAALADVETMPDALTVIVNEKEYFGDEAVAKINEVVAMFEAAEEGKTLKFFNEKGEMIVSFKATGADPEAVAYEAEVGGLAATVNETSYEVVPKYIDIATNTELTAKPEGTVTFRLVIQKK